MNKTISLNLSGMVFHAEEQAYDALSLYLRKIRAHFLTQEGGEEIVSDIEARLAELFSERIQDVSRNAITLNDVQAVLAEMGDPESFSGEDEPEQAYAHKRPVYNPTKKLYRDPDDRVLGGVCSGVAAYLGIDALWLRLLFAILFFGYGTGILLYIVLWIIVPVARTTAEKLSMRGEPANLDNISRFVKEEARSLRDTTYAKDGARYWANRISDVLVEILRSAVRVIAALFAVMAIFLASIMLLALVIGSLGLLFFSGFPVENPFLYVVSGGQMVLASIGLLFVLGVPLFWLIYKSLAYLLRFPGLGMRAGYAMLALWVLGFGCSLYAASDIAANFSQTATHRKLIPIASDDLSYYYIKTAETTAKKSRKVQFLSAGYKLSTNIETSEDLLWSDDIELNIVKSTSGKAELMAVLQSRGRDANEAALLASSIAIELEQQDSLLIIPASFQIPGDAWRNQDVKLVLRIPVGTSVELAPSLRRMLDDDLGISWTDRGLGKVCEMRQEGLHCIDCKNPSVILSGDGRVFEVRDFTGIVAGDNLNIRVRMGDVYKVWAEGSDREGIQVEVKGNDLELTMDDSDDDEHTVWIQMPVLRAMDISGAAHVEAEGFALEKLNIEASGAGSVRFTGKVERLDAEGSGASDMRLHGNIERMEYSGSGASQLFAGSCETKRADIRLSGAAQAEVQALEALTGKVSGASKIRYKGNPTTLEKQVSGGGKIVAID
jgi:phage shock protein PspC (stress-responsive transcriptional regulator)